MNSSNKLYKELYTAFSDVTTDEQTVQKLMEIVVKTFGSSQKWRYHADPEYRIKTVEGLKTRRQQNPEYDEKLKEQWRANAKKYAEDPEKRARKLAYDRERNRRIYAEKKQLMAQAVESH